ncbi:DUF5134 domain-containing protein [Streptomyces sp. NPDC047108]|uniref:DUF5134 domain-containing protein n=1 Tax=Streptomyces sp. NPDC047108 TaxID=3155025 RepID=UPI0033E1DE30
MHGPPLVGWLLVALCGAAGVLCLLRTRGGGPGQRSGAGGEALMGIGMAAMAVPSTVRDPQSWDQLVFAAVFTAAALHALLLARHGRHHLHHVVGALAMVHMALAPGHSGQSGQSGHGAHAAAQPGAGAALLTAALLVYFAVYVLRTGIALVPPAAGTGAGTGAGAAPLGAPCAGRLPPPPPASPTDPPGRTRWAHHPELATACRVSMGMGMFAMLLAV